MCLERVNERVDGRVAEFDCSVRFCARFEIPGTIFRSVVCCRPFLVLPSSIRRAHAAARHERPKVLQDADSARLLNTFSSAFAADSTTTQRRLAIFHLEATTASQLCRVAPTVNLGVCAGGCSNQRRAGEGALAVRRAPTAYPTRSREHTCRGEAKDGRWHHLLTPTHSSACRGLHRPRRAAVWANRGLELSRLRVLCDHYSDDGGLRRSDPCHGRGQGALRSVCSRRPHRRDRLAH